MQTFNFTLYNKESRTIDFCIEVNAESLEEALEIANNEFNNEYIIL